MGEDLFKMRLAEAKKGDLSAQLWVAQSYAEGTEVRRNEKKAFRWYLAAAEQGSAEAQTQAGRCYLDGKGVAKDGQKAIEWLRKAAAQGNGEACYGLAHCYEYGYEYGYAVELDYKEAMRYYRIAAKGGYLDAYFGIGKLYQFGKGVNKDLDAALSWYERGAEKGGRLSELSANALRKEMKKTPQPQKGIADAAGQKILRQRRADVKAVAETAAGQEDGHAVLRHAGVGMAAEGLASENAEENKVNAER